MPDPREAATLGEAALNPDGTYNGARAMSWLSAIFAPPGGKGVSEEEVMTMWDDIKAKREQIPGGISNG